MASHRALRLHLFPNHRALRLHLFPNHRALRLHLTCVSVPIELK
ncbi:MAG: hypothetical protein ACKER6_01255 [Candidatus Hodgkinia cicadicola]